MAFRPWLNVDAEWGHTAPRAPRGGSELTDRDGVALREAITDATIGPGFPPPPLPSCIISGLTP